LKRRRRFGLAIAAAALDGAEDFLRPLGSWIEAASRLANLLLAGARADACTPALARPPPQASRQP